MFQSVRGIPVASAFGCVIPVLNESCILFNLYKFVLFILPSSFDAHALHHKKLRSSHTSSSLQADKIAAQFPYLFLLTSNTCLLACGILFGPL